MSSNARPCRVLSSLALAAFVGACGSSGAGTGPLADASGNDGGAGDASASDGGARVDGESLDGAASDADDDALRSDAGAPEDATSGDAASGSDIGSDAALDSGADASEDGGADASQDAGEARGVLCQDPTPSPRPPRGAGTSPGAVSPFGTGASNDVILGALEDPSVLEDPIAFGAVSTSEDLEAVTYDVYVPPGYDGSEPYGLVAFINSGNNGGAPAGSYQALFESERLIQIAPDGAGNAVNIDIRMGRAMLGALRAMELFNIDDTRVYAMGNSGGARSAHMMLHQYPQLFSGALPRCGANYPREVDQDYETREPDSHYEFWGAGFFPAVAGEPYLDYLRSFEHRFALMVSFDDFREGDVMNIYHNGMEQDGLYARLIETPGGHCATNEAHFYDALGFVEHPLFEVVNDAFDDGALGTNAGVGSGAINGANAREAEGSLVLDGSESSALALLADRLAWNDRHGLILRASLDLSESASVVSTLALWPFDAERHNAVAEPSSFDASASPGVFVEVTREGEGGRVRVVVRPDEGTSIEVFSAPFDDWSAQRDEVDLKLEAWDAELQIDLGWHLGAPTIAATGARLLNDRRTIRVRWNELLGGAAWDATAWDEGAVVTLGAEGGVVGVGQVSAVDGVGWGCE